MSCAFSFVSGLFSSVSLMAWVCAQVPQIYQNYMCKHTEGILPLFLALWFLGDLLSFLSCLINDAVLKFQVFLSLYFLCNDAALCYQYYHYKDGYRVIRPPDDIRGDSDTFTNTETAILTATVMSVRPSVETLSLSDELAPSSFGAVDRKPSVATQVATVALMLHVAGAMAISKVGGPAASEPAPFTETLALVLAWGCTVVYMSSRCPQLYKNWQRKSVDGISPLLFGLALVGNLTYTFSILTSCKFLDAPSKGDFFWKELPYIMGSAGTVVFDVGYFYQRRLYRAKPAVAVDLAPWTSGRED